MTRAADLAEEIRTMQRLWNGRKDAWGIDVGGVARGELLSSYYAKHRMGKAGLGIFPIRDDNTVMFAAVDIDEHDAMLAWDVAETLPGVAWVEESRSKGYHVWVFFDEPLEAWAARAVLRGVILAVGRPDLEIFPKQDQLPLGGLGNYINLPLFGNARPILMATEDANQFRNTAPYKPATFLAAADYERTPAEPWRKRARALGVSPAQRAQNSETFGERNSLHVCAQYIFDNRFENPVRVGHRAVVLFNLAKMYANCRHYDELETKMFVEAVNQGGEDPIPEAEVDRFVRNAFTGEYTSTGCDDPLMVGYTAPGCPIARG